MSEATSHLHKTANDVVVLKFHNQGGYWQGKVGGMSHISRRQENQDTLSFLDKFRENLCLNDNLQDCVLVGVLDGHGKYGATVPLKVVECFNNYAGVASESVVETEKQSASDVADTTTKQPDAESNGNTGNAQNESSVENEEKSLVDAMKPMEEHDSIESLLTEMFVKTQGALEVLHSKKFNTRYSGTTATMAFLTPERYIIANVGDSDAVLAKLDPDTNKLIGETISVSHRPELDEERIRIEEAGGLVEAQRNRKGQPGNGPLRVWMKDVRTPGLMVSRSLGDLVAHTLGVIPKPTLASRRHEGGTGSDKFLILASDGVWDVLSVDEAVNYVDIFIDPETAATGLVELAVSRQRPKHYDNATAVVIFFEPPDVRRKRLEETYPDHASMEHTKRMEIDVLRQINLGPEPDKSSARRGNAEEDDVDHHTHVEIVQSLVNGNSDPNVAKPSSSSMCSIV